MRKHPAGTGQVEDFFDAQEPNIQVRITPGSTSEFWFVAKMVVIPASLSCVSSFRLGVDQFQACVVDFSLCWCRMPAIDSNSSMSQPKKRCSESASFEEPLHTWHNFQFMLLLFLRLLPLLLLLLPLLLPSPSTSTSTSPSTYSSSSSSSSTSTSSSTSSSSSSSTSCSSSSSSTSTSSSSSTSCSSSSSSSSASSSSSSSSSSYSATTTTTTTTTTATTTTTTTIFMASTWADEVKRKSKIH